MHWPDPAQRPRIAEIRGNLLDRIAEAEREGWLGEIEGLKVSLAGAEDKLAQIDRRTGHNGPVDLGTTIPSARSRKPPDMTADELATALRACAVGLYPLEAGTELLICNGTFLHRDDFTSRFITCGTSNGTPMAAIDWVDAISALTSGKLPCSGGERRILQLSASLAGGIPVDLRDAATGLDDRNIQRLVSAILHASGKPGSFLPC